MDKRNKKCEDFQVSYKNLAEVVEIADKIIKEHPYLSYKDFEFDVGYEYGDAYCEVEYYRSETDEEMNKRLASDRRRAREAEARRKMLYETLKEEFESGKGS